MNIDCYYVFEKVLGVLSSNHFYTSHRTDAVFRCEDPLPVTTQHIKAIGDSAIRFIKRVPKKVSVIANFLARIGITEKRKRVSFVRHKKTRTKSGFLHSRRFAIKACQPPPIPHQEHLVQTQHCALGTNRKTHQGEQYDL